MVLDCVTDSNYRILSKALRPPHRIDELKLIMCSVIDDCGGCTAWDVSDNHGPLGCDYETQLPPVGIIPHIIPPDSSYVCAGLDCNDLCTNCSKIITNEYETEVFENSFAWIENIQPTITIEYETEVLCKPNPNIIIGSADLLITECLRYPIDRVLYIDVDCGACGYGALHESCGCEETVPLSYIQQLRDETWYDSEEGELVVHNTYLIDAKPTLDDVGAAIRQLKIYRDILSKSQKIDAMAIVTREQPSDRIAALAKNEKIMIIVLPVKETPKALAHSTEIWAVRND